MNSFKLQMSLDEAGNYLNHITGTSVSNIRAIEMGELSKVFSFTKGDREFVAHFKSSRESFDKADYMYKHYSSHAVPIPRVVDIGSIEQFYYSITEKVPGKPISTFDEKDIPDILDSLAEEFSNISKIRIEKNKGFGWISPSGEASFKSWVDYLEDFFKIEEGGFYGDWTRLYEESFLERDVFESIYSKMIDLAKYAPEEPYLVHGDFHLGNMLSDGERITGIVDWEMAMYGDFILDLGVIHFWSPQLQFPQRVREAWEKQGRIIPYFKERLLCYQLFKGIDGLRFFAKKNHRPSYDYVKGKLLPLLEEV